MSDGRLGEGPLLDLMRARLGLNDTARRRLGFTEEETETGSSSGGVFSAPTGSDVPTGASGARHTGAAGAAS